MHREFVIFTNNPMVKAELSDDYELIFKELPFKEFLEFLGDKVLEGYPLLTHPLSGSVKPGETPYKSVLMAKRPLSRCANGCESCEELNFSEKLISNALTSYEKFKLRPDRFASDVLKDLQLIDLTLIKSAIESAIA